MKQRKWNIIFCSVAMSFILFLAGCGSSANRADHPEDIKQSVNSSEDTVNVGQSEKKTSEIQTEVSEGEDVDFADGILIVYFTVAENSGVDTVSSASYSMRNGEAVGRLRILADMIQENIGGELFSIQTNVVYPANGEELIDYASQEQGEDALPELTSHIEDLSQYETVFIG